MRISVIAVGTRGDVQPLIALAKGLHVAGHTVRVATNRDFAALVKEHELDYFELSGSPSEMMQSDAMQAAMGGNKNPVTLIRGILKVIKPQFSQGIREIWTSCQDTDLIVLSMLGFFGGYHVAEKLGVPFIEAYVLPGRPTRAFPSPLLGVNVRLGGTVNKLSHVVLLRLSWLLLQSIVNPVRKTELEMPPVSFSRRFRDMDRNHQPVLHGYSSFVLPKPRDWPDWYHITGYWFLDRPQTWQPPADLTDFLDAGPPPVYVGFGSMAGRDPERVAAIVLEALYRTRQRGILFTGWGGITTTDLPEDVLMIESVPHDWLFPRMAAVVHHGGSGTTAAGLRAGVPSIVVPFGGDQHLWGRQIHSKGAGPTPIPRKKLTVERLTEAIRLATNDEEMRRRATAIGEHIRAEDGIGRAVAVIDRMVRR